MLRYLLYVKTNYENPEQNKSSCEALDLVLPHAGMQGEMLVQNLGEAGGKPDWVKGVPTLFDVWTLESYTGANCLAFLQQQRQKRPELRADVMPLLPPTLCAPPMMMMDAFFPFATAPSFRSFVVRRRDEEDEDDPKVCDAPSPKHSSKGVVSSPKVVEVIDTPKKKAGSTPAPKKEENEAEDVETLHLVD